jgi:ribosomal protein L11 methyltransferase
LVEEAVTVGNVCRALDVGTGSGILALALAKLGVEHVCAIDTDAVACRAAAANIKRNGVKSVRITDDWQDVAETFDLIVANLFTNLLRDLAEELSCRLAKNASLICSGFLASDEAVVVAAYPDFQVIRRRDRDAWVALMLRRLDSLS